MEESPWGTAMVCLWELPPTEEENQSRQDVAEGNLAKEEEVKGEEVGI